MKSARIAVHVSAVFALLVSGVTFAAAPSFGCSTPKLVGAWHGRGLMRRDTTSPAEATRCRFKFLPASGKAAADPTSARRYVVNLDCRGIDVSFNLAGAITVDSKSGNIRGTLAGKRKGRLSISRQATGGVSGRCTTAGLRLKLRYRNWSTGNIDTPVMTTSFDTRGVLHIESKADPDSGAAGSGEEPGVTRNNVLFKARFKRQKRTP